MNKYAVSFVIFLIQYSLSAQIRIDSSFSFQSDPDKKYSIYIPSNYSDTIPSKLMLGLHPLNTVRWNAESWCDTLISFAETNDLILICPDGGIDGKIDDDIDTAFTSTLLDSMNLWYNINNSKIFAMGFSWGGKTTYTYGLHHANKFAGLMPIGAVITEIEIADIDTNSNGKNFYLIHGTIDSPNTRYTPLLSNLIENYACTKSLFMNGVGHTIDFPNRNNILTEAFIFLDSNSCNKTIDTNFLSVSKNKSINFKIYPSIISYNQIINVDFSIPNQLPFMELINNSGQLVKKIILNKNDSNISLSLKGISSGQYFIKYGNQTRKLFIQ